MEALRRYGCLGWMGDTTEALIFSLLLEDSRQLVTNVEVNNGQEVDSQVALAAAAPPGKSLIHYGGTLANNVIVADSVTPPEEAAVDDDLGAADQPLLPLLPAAEVAEVHVPLQQVQSLDADAEPTPNKKPPRLKRFFRSAWKYLNPVTYPIVLNEPAHTIDHIPVPREDDVGTEELVMEPPDAHEISVLTPLDIALEELANLTYSTMKLQVLSFRSCSRSSTA